MKKIILFVLIMNKCLFAFAQYSNETVKEMWDDKILHLLNPSDATSYESMLEPFHKNEDFTNIAGICSGDLEMYRTTLDKGYLVNFINESLKLLNLRKSNCMEWQPSLDGTAPNIFYDAIITGRLAEYCYLVSAESPYSSGIINAPIPITLINIPTPYSLGCSQSVTVSNLQTYGTYANWLADECKNTIDYYYSGQYYDPSEGFLNGQRNPSSPSCTDGGLLGLSVGHYSARAINQEAYYAITMLYLNQMHPFSDGTQNIPLEIAQRYKGNVDIYYPYGSCNSFSVLKTKSSSNSYWWYHAGWASPYFNPTISSCGCAKKASEYYKYMEDLGHGIWTMDFPLQAHKILANTYFDLNDMIRFHNTFSKNVFVGNNQFEAAIDGNSCTNLPNASGQNSTNNSGFQNDIFGTIGYYKYDNADATATPSLYDLVMQYYLHRKMNNTLHNATGGENKMSTLVKAQWEKECPRLTLYNRDLVYNQNFFAPRSLTIAPNEFNDFHHNNAATLDRPNFTSNEFIIEPNVTSLITSEESITIKAGTNFKLGSTVSVKLNNTCSIANFKLNNINSVTDVKTADSNKLPESNLPEQTIVKNNDLLISPNPFIDGTKLSVYVSQSQKISMYLFNSMGQVVKIITENENAISGIQTYTIERNNLPTGIYQLQLKTESGVINKQLVIQ